MGIIWSEIHRAYWIGDKLDRGIPLDPEEIEWLIRQKKKRAFFMAVQALAMVVLLIWMIVWVLFFR